MLPKRGPQPFNKPLMQNWEHISFWRTGPAPVPSAENRKPRKTNRVSTGSCINQDFCTSFLSQEINSPGGAKISCNTFHLLARCAACPCKTHLLSIPIAKFAARTPAKLVF